VKVNTTFAAGLLLENTKYFNTSQYCGGKVGRVEFIVNLSSLFPLKTLFTLGFRDGERRRPSLSSLYILLSSYEKHITHALSDTDDILLDKLDLDCPHVGTGLQLSLNGQREAGPQSEEKSE
jgi:hypothetical protein